MGIFSRKKKGNRTPEERAEYGLQKELEKQARDTGKRVGHMVADTMGMTPEGRKRGVEKLVELDAKSKLEAIKDEASEEVFRKRQKDHQVELEKDLVEVGVFDSKTSRPVKRLMKALLKGVID